VFHQGSRYDGTLAQASAGKIVSSKDSIPVDSVEKYKYLVGTDHIDLDNGLF